MNPVIVDIPAKMERYYGRGKMLHPDVEMVEQAVKSIPKGQVALLGDLCDKLSADYGTDVTCPMRSTSALKDLAKEYMQRDFSEETPFWRVIRNNHLLINSAQRDLNVTLLEQEGFTLGTNTKGDVAVQEAKERLFEF